MVEYKYDAWGNHAVLDANGADIASATHIGNLNPFRYRGYYYDTETGLYFLKTRYYDPEVGRFITIDDISYIDPETINGLNLYAYCGNNPVMRVDENGNAWWEWLVGALLVIAVTAAVVVTAEAAA
ncbi:MAG TPA: RHS repeat-associated core domain-containing protein [Candidatus Borkfalkia avicola]|uniref:RHS repeat-associated core domain-containing protein n=1 Tax=Candidatus Borkfalkia avicola TaxID=2838503 RepID=A0A9D2D6X5_9FIRM|nr:RHS repeat-associated core domain-containing protein [Candidatus Borkfalkia avicola]